MSCPPVAPFGGTITATLFAPEDFLGERAIGHNWDSMTGTIICPATNSQLIWATVELVDAAHAHIQAFGANTTPGGSSTLIWDSLVLDAAMRAAVRYVRFYAKNNSTSPITQSATFQVDSYTGPCDDVPSVALPSRLATIVG